MRRIATLAVLLLLTLASGCSHFEPEEYVPFTPTAQMRAWWTATETCAGRTGDFERVQWFMVPGESFECPGGTCLGRWEANHRIYVAEAWLDHELVVRHEMLHEILRRGGHPARPFEDPCHLTWKSWEPSAESRLAALRRRVPIE